MLGSELEFGRITVRVQAGEEVKVRVTLLSVTMTMPLTTDHHSDNHIGYRADRTSCSCLTGGSGNSCTASNCSGNYFAVLLASEEKATTTKKTTTTPGPPVYCIEHWIDWQRDSLEQ